MTAFVPLFLRVCVPAIVSLKDCLLKNSSSPRSLAPAYRDKLELGCCHDNLNDGRIYACALAQCDSI